MSVPVLKPTIAEKKPLWALPINKPLCVVLLQALMAIPGFSQTIGNWAFTNTTAGTAGTNNTVSVADFSAAIPTRAFNGSGEYYGEDAWPAGGINTSTYVQFSISPNSGYGLNLSSVILRIRRSNTGSPMGSGPTTWSLRSSLDGYASDIASNSLVHTYANYTVPLGPTYHHIYSTLTFRLYGYNVLVNSGGLSRVVLDNISIQGIGELLPVQLSAMQALCTNNKEVMVKWKMDHVEAGTAMQVQRSVNGADFTNVHTIAENEHKATHAYQYLDNQAPTTAAVLYYRVKGVTAAGSTFLSPVVKISQQAVTGVQIDHTSFQGRLLHTSVQVPENGSYYLSIVNMNGSVLQQRKLALEAGAQVLSLPLSAMPRGTYVVRVTHEAATVSKQFILY